jgi:hypothetical protein
MFVGERAEILFSLRNSAGVVFSGRAAGPGSLAAELSGASTSFACFLPGLVQLQANALPRHMHRLASLYRKEHPSTRSRKQIGYLDRGPTDISFHIRGNGADFSS